MGLEQNMPKDGPGDLIRRIVDLERTVRELSAARTLNNATIDSGGLTIKNLGRLTFEGGSISMKDNADREWVYFGGFASNGFGVKLTRINGSVAIAFTDTDPVAETNQVLQLADRNGAALLTEDLGGSGLSWPLLPIPFAPLSWPGWPNNNAGTFAAVEGGYPFRHSPRILVQAKAISDGTATGEVRLTLNGAQVGATVAVPNLTMTTAAWGPFSIPGNTGDQLSLELEARVASGSGKTYAKVVQASFYPS